MDDLCRNLFDGKNPVAIALGRLAPGAQYTVRGYTMDDVEWSSPDVPKPTQTDLDSMIQTLVSEQRVLNTWLPQRLDAYPTIQQQLDMLYWDQVNSTTVWKYAIASVKQRFPKGS